MPVEDDVATAAAGVPAGVDLPGFMQSASQGLTSMNQRLNALSETNDALQARLM